ncbi:putative integral membrane protein, conserved [Candida maltosa Xu316]|uniref:Putative integral membrane protein, conserved n=1 Tax=Candida maltosa (strain Xu316) TaxID=1245528 RepID=M3K740_CANMX|nr:putative integral membrane protein, conserved [Candida maltosa Xu316]
MIHNHSVIYNNNNNLLRNLLKYHLKVSLRSAITPEEQRVLFNLLTRFIRTIRLLLKISINTFSKTFKLIFVQKSVISTFLFAYIYEVVPKLISRFFRRLFNLDFKNFGNEVARILQAPLSPERLPIFMTKLVATLNAFTPIYASILEPHVSPSQIPFMSSLLAAFTSSMLNFPSFQNKKLLKNDRYYTLDWTLILVTRAVDTIITSNFSNVFKTSTRSANMAGRFGDVFMFILSCFFIMDNWFYNPDKLTPDYRNWISQSGQIDEDVLVGLRKFKDGEMEYMSNSEVIL